MAQQGKRIQVVIVILLFIIYFFSAARPISREIILAPRWICSLESGVPVFLNTQNNTNADIPDSSRGFFPFTLGNRFGYVDSKGQFAINQVKNGNIYLSENMWTEYSAEPSKIEIMDISANIVLNIEDPRGYPVLLDDRVFIVNSEQNALSAIGKDGSVLWTYEFGAPLTCIDAAAGYVLTGSIDGIIEILDSEGTRVFYFEPGGSRYSVILGCAISRNGSRLGIISGIDQQRFLMIERYGSSAGEYKVVYHEFLDTGFRRPVHISFIDQDRRIVYERFGGIGCYNIKARKGIRIPVDGDIAAIETSGDDGLFFLINSVLTGQKELLGVRFPQENWLSFFDSKRNMRDNIFLKAAFKSDDVFLGRYGSKIITGGGSILISFDLEEK